jgi:hypothetical protein
MQLDSKIQIELNASLCQILTNQLHGAEAFFRNCSAIPEILDEFDSRHYQKKKVVGLERGPLSLVSTTEELLDRKVAAPV